MKFYRGGLIHRILQNIKHKVTELEEKNSWFDAMFSHLDQGFLVVDANGVITECNESNAKFMGYKREDLIGKHVADIVENTRMHIVAETGIPEMYQIQKLCGQEMLVNRTPVFKNGKLVAVVGNVMFRDIGNLFTMTEKFKKLNSELEYYKAVVSKNQKAVCSFDSIIGKSQALEQVKTLAKRISKSDSTVLIKGETGTGKELFAHSIYTESGRNIGPFIKVNCAAIPESLFEAEFFGYKEGAFTGALKKGKKGKFALANHGTILLDEISEMPLLMQGKLLRVLQEKEIEPIGASRTEPVDVRILAATNKDLEVLVDQGLFRNDLYYRLNIITLDIPPLRDRHDDIPLLIDAILRQLEEETGIIVDGIDVEAQTVFKNYTWPGNIRELRNVLERIIYTKAGNMIIKSDIPSFILRAFESSSEVEQHTSLKSMVQQFEEDIIRKALKESKGDKIAVARSLGIGKTTLYDKMKQFEITGHS
jgi:PAS domain S-box-containing protein